MSAPPASLASPTSPLGAALGDAIGYWEPRRIGYNLALAAVVLGWAAFAWRRLHGLFGVDHLLSLIVLAVLANVCYCAAYVVDIPVQLSAFRGGWRRHRWMRWLLGTLSAMTLAWFWIGDEVLPVAGGGAG